MFITITDQFPAMFGGNHKYGVYLAHGNIKFFFLEATLQHQIGLLDIPGATYILLEVQQGFKASHVAFCLETHLSVTILSARQNVFIV